MGEKEEGREGKGGKKKEEEGRGEGERRRNIISKVNSLLL